MNREEKTSAEMRTVRIANESRSVAALAQSSADAWNFYRWQHDGEGRHEILSPRRWEDFVEDQRVSNLEEMNEEQARQFLIQLYSNLSPEEEYNLRHQDYVMEMPQSGERFRGRENMRAFQRARGNHAIPPRSLKLRRVLVKEGLWVAEAVIDYGDGRVFDVVLILELRDGKMWRDRWYFAEPFEAPEWRGGGGGRRGWHKYPSLPSLFFYFFRRETRFP